MLVRLLYASRANTEIDESILGSILGRSHKNNLELADGSVNLERVNVGSILCFSEKPILDPFSMTSEGALTLLEELASAAAIVSRDGA